MKILVTGATGFIGRCLMRRLSRQHEVLALIRNQRRSLPCENVTAVVMPLSEQIDTRRLPMEIDVIIHLAQANVSFPEAANELFAVNTVSTQHLLDYAQRSGVQRFIFTSTGDVYGWRTGWCREQDAVAPNSYYALTKHVAEMLTQAYAHHFRICILRLFHPYGPNQTDRLIPKLAQRIQQQESIRLHNDNRPRFTPIYIDDVVIAIERAIESSHSGVVNVAGDEVVSIRELAEEIGGVLEKRPIFEKRNQDSGDWMGDNALMKQVFGTWTMVKLSDGLSSIFKEQNRRCPTGA